MIPLLIVHSNPLLWTAGSAQVVLLLRMTVSSLRHLSVSWGFQSLQGPPNLTEQGIFWNNNLRFCPYTPLIVPCWTPVITLLRVVHVMKPYREQSFNPTSISKPLPETKFPGNPHKQHLASDNYWHWYRWLTFTCAVLKMVLAHVF